MKREIEFQILQINEETGALLVRFFPKEVAKTDVDGVITPEWFLGPWWYDISHQYVIEGQPISPDTIKQMLSNACPMDLVEREIKRRSSPNGFDMSEVKKHVGVVHPVVSNSPIITTSSDPLNEIRSIIS